MRRRAYELKQLQTLQLLTGDVVHRTLNVHIQRFKEGKSVLDGSEMIADALKSFDARFQFSEQRGYATTSKSHAGDVFCALVDHEYGIPVSAEDIQSWRDTIQKAITNFFTAEVDTRNGPLRVCNLLKSASFVESEYDGFDFHLEGVLVRLKIDLALLFRSGNQNQAVLIDWKLEKNEHANNETQLMIYGYGCLKYWGLAGALKPEDIVLLEVNLFNCTTKRYEFTDKQVAVIDDLMFESIRELKHVMNGRPYEDFRLTEFPLTQNANSCRICNLKEVCLQYLQSEEEEHGKLVLELFSN